MPAVITHYLHAEAVREKLKEKGIKTDKRMLFWGAQGPDIMYFHRAMPHQPGISLRRIGSALHTGDPEVLFKTMEELCRGGYKDVCSYAIGFLCHYSLDRMAHPYVYAFQKDYILKNDFRHNPSYIHNLIEHNVDIILLHDRKSIKPAEMPIDVMLSGSKSVINRQAEFMQAILLKLIPGSGATLRRIRRAFCDMRTNTSMMFDRHGKKKFVSAVERIFHTGPAVSSLIEGEEPDGYMDYMNEGRAAWSNPFEENAGQTANTFYDVFNNSVQDAVNLILTFLECVKGEKAENITGGLTFSRGVPYMHNISK